MEKEPMNIIKDDTYYFNDGNREFRVGDHLFRLHGSILQMHSTFFRNMFSLPQGPDKTFNGQEDGPMVCDDSPDEFRALCWALYADPLDTGNEREVSATNVRKVARIGLLAHKYEFPKIEQWIVNICGKLPPPEILATFQLDDLKYFAQVISHCGWKTIKEQFDERIINGVLQEKNDTAIATASTLCNAIHVADHVDDEILRARVYYNYLASACWDLHPGERRRQKTALKLDMISSRSSVLPLSSLSDHQKLSLFCGFSSLQVLRNRLRYFPVTEPFPSSCDTTLWRSCHSIWTSWWASQLEKLEAFSYLDGPLDFLSAMIKRATKDPPHLPGHANSSQQQQQMKDCAAFVIGQLTELKQAFVNDLPNYFRGP